MASVIRYHLGGFQPAKANKNKAEELDSATGYSNWDADGTLAEQRALTMVESVALAAQDAQSAAETNGSTLRQRAQAALAVNDAFAAAAKPATAAAQASQAWDQAQRLTKECSALIRLVIGQLDSTNGT